MKDKFNEKDFSFSFGIPHFKFFWKEMPNFFNMLGRRDPCFHYFGDTYHSKYLTPFTEIKKDHERYEISLELPGVTKDEINLEITSEELWLEAESEEFKKKYRKHMIFKNTIKINETKAILKSGILKVIAPFEEKISKTKLKID